jgi:hydroxymethylpyrimidine/phosphomethylpyrimidine kinase
MTKSYYRVLTIAGSDSGGGAGIQADLKTFGALGCFGMSVITALTAQNTTEVRSIHPVPPSFIADQLEAVLSDIGVDAVKVGMLHSPEVIEVVAEKLKKYQVTQLVIDPVMVAKSGDKLLQEEAIDALKSKLIPLALLITPNLPEAAVLLGDLSPIDHQEAMFAAAQRLTLLGAKAVLLKGGHLAQDMQSNDVFYLKETHKQRLFKQERIHTRNTHGTGCTLSSAIAAYLAKGSDLETAVGLAKAYLSNALISGQAYLIGKGHGPVNHFWALQNPPA